MTHLYARLSGALLLFLLLAVPAQAADTIPTAVVDGAVVWTPDGPYATALLAVTSPSGLEYRRAFAAGEAVRLDPSAVGEAPMPDGFYAYELVVAETLPDSDEPTAVRMQRGTLEVRGGLAVASPLLDHVINDDLIVLGSACIGLDCVNGESFGFDTLRLKENNLRIHFQDTSTSASFPTNDWRIVINDSSNGGANYFAIEDSNAGRQPFRVEAGASANSIRVRSNGDVGFGTATPVVRLHAADGDSPTLRLEQNGSSGFTPQTWDVAGNEANFFIRDATNGSQLPFRIKPNSPSNSIFVDTDGVGINTSNPSNPLHVIGKAVVEGDFGTDQTLTAFDVVNTNPSAPTVGNAGFLFTVRGGGNVTAYGTLTSFDNFQVVRDFSVAPTRFGIRVNDRGGLGGAGLDTFSFIGATGDLFIQDNTATHSLEFDGQTGNLTVTGTVSGPSDVNVKENIVPADVDAVLEGVAGLPIATWEYIADPGDALHLGPMAQDFAAAFGLGANDTTISMIDGDGVALAAIQALHARNEAAQARIAELEARTADLEARLARLEALIQGTHE